MLIVTLHFILMMMQIQISFYFFSKILKFHDVHVHESSRHKKTPYFNHMSKVFPIDVVICFDENLSQSALSYGVVLCVELVKSMKGVPILQQNSLFRFQRNVPHQNTCKYKN